VVVGEASAVGRTKALTGLRVGGAAWHCTCFTSSGRLNALNRSGAKPPNHSLQVDGPDGPRPELKR